MPIPLSIIIRSHGNLADAAVIFDREARRGLNLVGRRLRATVRGKVKVFERAEQRGVQFEIQETEKGLMVFIYGSLIQHIIDELGLPPGTFQPWDRGTRIYHWVERRGFLKRPAPIGEHRPDRALSHLRQARNARRGRQYQQRRANRLARPLSRRSRTQREALGKNAAARAQDNLTRRAAFLVARKIFESGIRPGAPFARSLTEQRDEVIQILRDAVLRAISALATPTAA